MTVDFNINILSQLLTLHPEKVKGINSKFPKIGEWQQQTEKPTIKQLSGLADYFNIPFGFFFFKNIPVIDIPIPHYRTIARGVFKPSQELLDTIRIVEERQEWAAYLLKELNHEPLQYLDTARVGDDIVQTAQKIRDILGIHGNWAKYENLRTWQDAFKFLILRAEAAGINVIVNGIVANDTTRKLSLQEFRGFVLYNEYAPFIFVNSRDFITGRIFTIIHEIVHLLLGESASFDFQNLQPSNNSVEEYCDTVTAEVLVSTESLLENIKTMGKNIQALAALYKVSRIVIARRLLDLDKISYSEFIEALNTLKISSTESTRQDDNGKGNFYNMQPNRIGRGFFNLMYSAVKQNKMGYTDAFRLTGLTPKGFDTYVDKYVLKK